MRASILVLGPLVARFGEARVSLPGGCAIGLRPVDQHIKGLQAMGAEIDIEHGYIHATARAPEGRAHRDGSGDGDRHRESDDGGRAGRGHHGHRERRARARGGRSRRIASSPWARSITGQGTDVITIEGVSRLHGATYRVMPDRIETGTFLVAAAATGGEIRLQGHAARHPRRRARASCGRPARAIESGPDWLAIAKPRADPQGGEHPYRSLPGFPHRHAGAVHGSQRRGARNLDDHRDHVRESLHARAGTAPAGRRHRGRRQHRGRARRAEAGRRDGDGDRSARLGVPGARRPGGGGRDRRRPRLPSRSRLRVHRGEAVRSSARASAGRAEPPRKIEPADAAVVARLFLFSVSLRSSRSAPPLDRRCHGGLR